MYIILNLYQVAIFSLILIYSNDLLTLIVNISYAESIHRFQSQIE